MFRRFFRASKRHFKFVKVRIREVLLKNGDGELLQLENPLDLLGFCVRHPTTLAVGTSMISSENLYVVGQVTGRVNYTYLTLAQRTSRTSASSSRAHHFRGPNLHKLPRSSMRLKLPTRTPEISEQDQSTPREVTYLHHISLPFPLVFLFFSCTFTCVIFISTSGLFDFNAIVFSSFLCMWFSFPRLSLFSLTTSH